MPCFCSAVGCSNRRNAKTKEQRITFHRCEVILLLRTCWISYKSPHFNDNIMLRPLIPNWKNINKRWALLKFINHFNADRDIYRLAMALSVLFCSVVPHKPTLCLFTTVTWCILFRKLVFDKQVEQYIWTTLLMHCVFLRMTHKIIENRIMEPARNVFNPFTLVVCYYSFVFY